MAHRRPSCKFRFLRQHILPKALVPPKCGFSFYLRTAPALNLGATVRVDMPAKLFRKELPTVGALGIGAAGPVLRQVGTTFVEPTGGEYEPTDGCTTDPYPPSPGACANANVLVRLKAVVNAIVVSFMAFLLSCLDKNEPHSPH